MVPSSYVGLLRRWWLTFVIAAVVGAVGGWLAAATTPPTYVGQVRMLVGPVNADFDTLRASSELTRTYADLATSDEIIEQGLLRSGLALSAEELDRAVRATGSADSRLVTIEVELGNADDAARTANAIAEALTAFTGGGTERPEGELRVVNAATTTASQTATRTALIVALATLGAALGALLVVTAIEALDGTLRDGDQLRRVAGAGYMGMLSGQPSATASRGQLGRLLPGHRPQQGDDGAFRVLLSDVIARGGSQVRSLMVAAAGDRADAGYVAAGLGAAAAQIGSSVTVLDAGPGITSLDVPAEPEPADGAGTDMPSPTGGQDARRSSVPRYLGFTRGRADTARIGGNILRRRDLLIVDAGAAEDSFGATIWAGDVDSVIVVVPLGRSHRDELLHFLDRLAGAGARVVYVVGLTRRGDASAIRIGSAGAPTQQPAAPRVWAGSGGRPSEEGPATARASGGSGAATETGAIARTGATDAVDATSHDAEPEIPSDTAAEGTPSKRSFRGPRRKSGQTPRAVLEPGAE